MSEEMKKDKIEELSNLIKIIINNIDMLKEHIDLDFMDQVINDMEKNYKTATSIGFIIGKRSEDFDKGAAALDTMKKLRDLIKARYHQKDVALEQKSREENLEGIKKLANLFS